MLSLSSFNPLSGALTSAATKMTVDGWAVTVGRDTEKKDLNTITVLCRAGKT